MEEPKTEVKDSELKRERKPFNWKKFLTISLPSLAGAIVIALGVTLFAGKYPTHIDGLGNRIKYRCGIPNNALALNMFESYQQARDAGLDDMADQYLEASYRAKPNNNMLLDSLSHTYFRLGVNTDKNDSLYFSRATILCQRFLKKDPKNTRANDLLAKSLYNSGERDAAYKIAESILLENHSDPLAIDMMCRKAVTNKDWKSLVRWGERYTLIDTASSYRLEIMYFYAKGLYETGDKLKAEKIYYEAVLAEPESHWRDVFVKAGGTPCVITSLKVQNTNYEGNIINKAGSALYDDKVQFLHPIITIKPLKTGKYRFDIKLFFNGELQHQENDTSGYTYSKKNINIICDKYPDGLYHIQFEPFKFLEEKDTIVHDLGGWGADATDVFSPGIYRYEIWWEGEKLFTQSFDIYSGYWHRWGYGNRFD